MIPFPPRARSARRPVPLAVGTAPAGNADAIYVPPAGVAQARLSRPQIAMFQQILVTLGYTDQGRNRADGVLGPATRRAVEAFQRDVQPLRLAAETTPLGIRARAFAAAVRSLRVDGDLGPETQRWLTWLALPADEGGGGEGTDYATVPVVGDVTPTRIPRTGGRFVAPVAEFNREPLLTTVDPAPLMAPSVMAPIRVAPTPEASAPPPPDDLAPATQGDPMAQTSVPSPPAEAGVASTRTALYLGGAAAVAVVVGAVLASRSRENPSQRRHGRYRRKH